MCFKIKLPPGLSGRRGFRSVIIALVCFFVVASPAQTPSTNSISVSKPREALAETVVLPKSVPDPVEPINRAIWAFNQTLMTGVIKPTARGYRFIVVKPVRTGIGNFGRNVTYPGRLINNLLQGKWTGARVETDRFFCNTFAGGAGFFGCGDSNGRSRSRTRISARRSASGAGSRDAI